MISKIFKKTVSMITKAKISKSFQINFRSKIKNYIHFNNINEKYFLRFLSFILSYIYNEESSHINNFG